MKNDYDVELTRKDGSVRSFRIYGQPTPKGGDVITLPVEGQVVKARITEPSPRSDVSQTVDRAQAAEV